MILKIKTVLITNADGFTGSHLTEALVKDAAKFKDIHFSLTKNKYVG
jgi:nucleoside-diphosphate-sugar epimerase